MTNQPKALYLIVFIQMWECFSFYGMRVLLVLYMINELHFSDGAAFGIFALYTGLVELGGIVGGIVADRLLGLRRAITLGGWLIAGGHLTLALGQHSVVFFPALALIVVGSSLFSTNLSALLGLQYSEGDSRRESGFTLFYSGINLGALLASLLCGYIGEEWGWHYGFGLAFIGMTLGNLTLFLFGSKFTRISHKISDNLDNLSHCTQTRSSCRFDNGLARLRANLMHHLAQFAPRFSEKSELEQKRDSSKRQTLGIIFASLLAVYFISQALIHEEIILRCLPWICVGAIGYVATHLLKSDRWETLAKLGLYLIALSLFFAAEEQMGSSITLFSERHTTKSLFNIYIPPAVLLSINPLIIILFGTWLPRPKTQFPYQIAVPFTLATCAFGGLALACFFVPQPLPIVLVMVALMIISLGELILGPSVYSLCSEMASKGNRGMVMGLVPIGFSMAAALGGYFSKWMAVVEENRANSLSVYQEGFTAIAMLLGIALIVITSALVVLSSKNKIKIYT